MSHCRPSCLALTGVRNLATRQEFNASEIYIVGRIRTELLTLSPSGILRMSWWFIVVVARWWTAEEATSVVIPALYSGLKYNRCWDACSKGVGNSASDKLIPCVEGDCDKI
ncbi:hypothetical protein Pcinc_019404 [Petrolisthes cinctipes]|uniref:Uncharacterized protein n=1 Tax=Petrolisthes cinctipes TaxID=88211 RepID=A0AAE1FLN1_PETCI|nr:hypothetical protein Pcinc_019404 [Petrolisthes cinctipes]